MSLNILYFFRSFDKKKISPWLDRCNASKLLAQGHEFPVVAVCEIIKFSKMMNGHISQICQILMN